MIVVTTPTGTIGRQVVHQLLDAGEPVRVIVRDPARLPAEIRDQVRSVIGTHNDPAVLAQAFADADAVFWLVPPDAQAPSLASYYVDFTRPAAAALTAHPVGRVVGISALGRGTPQAAHAGHVTASLAMDDLLAATGVPYRALTMPSFMDNLLWQADLIRTQGFFAQPIAGNRKLPTCATRDIATVAVRLLRDSSWTGSGEVPVLGPEDLSFDEMAQILSELLHRRVHYRRTPDADYKALLVAQGMSESVAQGMLDMMRAKNKGLDNAAIRTPDNSTPTTFRQWCEEVLLPVVHR
ncbi:NAD(P)H-binding protein [Pseudosporangium ferrugineum]|uniref:Uncharacterized protein YbjT (DUF2867 family) n=1 Tax=Pseudosporangium ferrugineum TaxID=439699 RepID=A0A2T0S483_9ACTN|nr:NAD(P)H-binding protein [Pseudosporangium ferrugineum]PRY28228.1 uncharacterized protein YbjT (DUF2867 family) [Pseudosporangium ferrugineum]